MNYEKLNRLLRIRCSNESRTGHVLGFRLAVAYTPKCVCSSLLTNSESRVSHSQTSSNSHPLLSSSARTHLSRCWFAVNLACQKSTRDFGVAVSRQPCRCQKQPWTNTIVFHLGNKRSGFPGSFESCSLMRSPRPCAIDLTTSSGVVSLQRIALIMRLRCEGETMSMSTEPPIVGMVELGSSEIRWKGSITQRTFGVAKNVAGNWRSAVSTNGVGLHFCEHQCYALELKYGYRARSSPSRRLRAYALVFLSDEQSTLLRKQ